MSINTPETCGDETINQLWEGADMTDKLDKLFGHEMKQAEAVQAALNRIDRVMHEKPEIDLRRRAFDIEVEYLPHAPRDQRFRATDRNTYDGAPDAEAPATFVGYGAGAKEARMALLSMFAEYDGVEPPQPPRTRTVHSSPFQPPEHYDVREDSGDFDDDLESR